MATIHQTELIKELAEELDVTKADAANYLNHFKDIIKKHVASGDDVTLYEFGRFARAHRAPRQGRNPQTGKEIQIPATYTPTFKASASFKQAVRKNK